MRCVPTLIRPQLLSARNSFLRGSSLERSRSLLVVVISLLLAYTSYTISAAAMTRSLISSPSTFGDSTLLLSSIVAIIFFTVVATGSVAALNTLFLGSDINLLLPAPMTRAAFLGSKSLTVAVHVGWQLCVIGFPPICAYGVVVGASAAFYPIALFLALTLIVEAVIGAIIIALVVGACIPPQRGRYLVISLCIAFIAAATGYIGTLPQPKMEHLPHEALLNTATRLSSCTWCPATHGSAGIIAAAHGEWHTALIASACTVGAGICGWVFLRVVDALLYQRALTMLQTTSSGTIMLPTRGMRRITQLIARLPFLRRRSSSLALISKEYRSFARDLIHAAQLGLLITLSLFFVMFFRLLERPRDLDPALLPYWEVVFLACNIVLSSFVVLSIGARFVFPSVSLERDNFWILQCAPISPTDILRAKCQTWFMPLALIAATISCAGAMALGSNPACVILSALVSITMTYGLVGLGIGIGAMYKHFTWEYEAQLGTNTGNFIFMGLGMLGIALQVIPVAILFALCADDSPISLAALPSAIIASVILLALLWVNSAIRSITLHLGTRALNTLLN